MESQPQNPEFRINPENFHPCLYGLFFWSVYFSALTPCMPGNFSQFFVVFFKINFF